MSAPTTAAPVLSIRDLVTEFSTPTGPVRAVDGLSLDVRPGEILGVVGESGSGKSISMLSVLGLVLESEWMVLPGGRCAVCYHPESGEPFVYGRDRDAGWWDEPVSFERDEDDWRADPEFAAAPRARGPLAQAKLTFLRRAIVGRLNAPGCVMAPFRIPTLEELHAWFERTLASHQYANAK